MDLSFLADAQTWISLLTLTLLEVVLGIDNIVFITILAGRVAPEKQRAARRLGLGIALVSRIALLAGISWVMHLTNELFSAFGHSLSGKDLILIVGGLFLIGKATHEIYENVEHPEHGPSVQTSVQTKAPSYLAFVLQVLALDVIFSLDSVITAVGLVEHLPIMIAAVVIAIVIMMVFAGPVGDFVQKRASIRVLALAFLVLIGFVLLFEGFEQEISKGYIYFSMAFALGMQLLNMRMEKHRQRPAPAQEATGNEALSE
ncbi:MAG: TerC family protein [Myxococcota bacterium]|jgi:predicted tellurium resistance membrane protein TerC|nr:TerC family protein [Myxococcota bacterium]